MLDPTMFGYPIRRQRRFTIAVNENKVLARVGMSDTSSFSPTPRMDNLMPDSFKVR